MADFQGGCFRNIGSELGGEFFHVVSEERGLVAGAGEGDVGEAGVEQVGVDAGIGVNEDAFGGEALGTVTGDGIAVVEMTRRSGYESAWLSAVRVLCGVQYCVTKPPFSRGFVTHNNIEARAAK